MRMTWFSLPAALIGISACSQTGEQQPAANEANQVAPEIPGSPVTNETANVSLPDDRMPLEEPKEPIDPKSAEAAGQVVQHYGALIEEKRFSQAEKLWGDGTTATGFTLQLKRYPEVHIEIGKPGDMEGAAGSSYVTVPVIFYGKDKNAANIRRAADVSLR